MAKQQQGKGINSQVLSQAGSLASRFQEMTGVDLARLPQMTEQELAQIADRAHTMQQLQDVLPILEKHFQTLMRGQVAYEEFVQRSIKEANQAGRKIDRAMASAFLADRGYTQHLEALRQKIGLQSQLQDANLASQLDLNRLDFASALQLVKMKHDRASAQIGQKLPLAMERMSQAEQQREAQQRRKDIAQNGSRSGFSRIRSFFGG